MSNLTSPYESILQRFTDNIQVVRKAFKWQNTLSVRLAAMLLASSGKRADAETLLAIKALLKANAGVFSNMRGNSSLPLIALLSQSDDSAQELQRTLQVQDLLKAQHFWRNDYLAIAAAQISLHTPPEQYDATVSRARAFYDAMREKHSVITGADDYILSCLLAISGLEVQATTAKIESLMVLLKPHFAGAPNVRQNLAQVLALGGSEITPEATLSAEEVVWRIVDLREAFRAQQLTPAVGIAAVLGVLSLLPGTPEAIALQVADCHAALKANPAFGKWQSKQTTLLFAASLVTLSLAADLNSTANATLANTIANLIIAQQTAMIAASTAATSAATSS